MKTDLNTIPYDAPLSFPPPTAEWLKTVGWKGTNRDKCAVPAADLIGRTVVVVGGNNGIGREAALKFAEWGADLLLACRQPPAHETHPNAVVDECLKNAKATGKVISAEWWEIDMASISSVEAFARRWSLSGKSIDILCMNAGMGSSPGGAEVFRTKDGFEIIHQVNFLSHVLLTLSLLPFLAKSKAPRIVCTTSGFHYSGKFDLTNFDGEKGDPGLEGVQFYKNNKLWYQTWITELQHRLLRVPAYRHITVNGIHPGFVNSGIWNLNRRLFFKQLFVQGLAWMFAISPQQGSLAILNAATSPSAGPDPKVQGVGDAAGQGGGRYFNRIWEEEPMPHCLDRDCRQRVWRKVNDELDLQKRGLLDIIGLDYVE